MPPGNPPAFIVDAQDDGDGVRINVAASDGRSRRYSLPGREAFDYFAFFRELHRDFGTRLPNVFADPADLGDTPASWKPLLTENASPEILCGYGDPAVLSTDRGYYLLATSNDAPDAFPILHSDDLIHWQHRGFVFAAGAHPTWAASGRFASDFWAPEMVKSGDEYWVVYTARRHNGRLAIGLARSPSPEGPFADNGAPLIEEGDGEDVGIIDSHIFVDSGGERYLFWKEDRNGKWPLPLARLVRDDPQLAAAMFECEDDQLSAAFAAAILGFASRRGPMERSFLMSGMIEAATHNWQQVRGALAQYGAAANAIVDAMTTPVRVQRLADDGRSLVGRSTVVLANDLDWEGHVIEGPFCTLHDGRYWLFYAANDFGTPAYGIGVAVADNVLGPYRKQTRPLLTSTRNWTAPGHPSVAPGVDGNPQLFFHAFHPGTGGYNAFRALLTARLQFVGERVILH